MVQIGVDADLTVVFDTNVLVSAEGYAGPPLDCWTVAQTTPTISIVTSEAAIGELDRVLGYDRLPISARFAASRSSGPPSSSNG